MNAKVFLDTCREYDLDKIQRILADGVAYCGAKIPYQSKVLVKPNVLSANRPEQAITTHPAMVEAMVRLLLDNRNEVIVADSSCMPGRTAHALEKTGLAEVGKRLGVLVKPLEEYPSRIHSAPDGRVLQEVNLPKILDDVDAIVNMPKLKSHMLTRLTAGVKNLFGCIPGGGKQQAHVQAPSAAEFSQLLIDLYGLLRPKVAFNVLDGILGLDGFGPGPTGRPTRTGFIAVGTDAVALDTACCRVIGRDPDFVYTNKFARERNVAPVSVETNQDLGRIRFRIPGGFPLQTFLFKHVSGLQRRRPAVIVKKCEQCGVCAKVCPARCIEMNGYPQWDYAKCIYCYCCHECCPHAAIKLKVSLLPAH